MAPDTNAPKRIHPLSACCGSCKASHLDSSERSRRAFACSELLVTAPLLGPQLVPKTRNPGRSPSDLSQAFQPTHSHTFNTLQPIYYIQFYVLCYLFEVWHAPSKEPPQDFSPVRTMNFLTSLFRGYRMLFALIVINYTLCQTHIGQKAVGMHKVSATCAKVLHAAERRA